MWKCQQEQRVFPTVWLRNCPSQYSKEYSSLYYTPLNWTTPLQPSFTAVYFLSGKKVMTGAWKGHLQVTSKKQVLLYYEYRARFCKWQYANSSILLYTHTHTPDLSLYPVKSHLNSIRPTVWKSFCQNDNKSTLFFFFLLLRQQPRPELWQQQQQSQSKHQATTSQYENREKCSDITAV